MNGADNVEAVMFCVAVVASLIPLAAITFVIVVLVRRAREKARIDELPVTTTLACLVGKRAHMSGMSNRSVSTRYYATFELKDGQRVEFRIYDGYGLLIEGDQGHLIHQGPRFKEFRRIY